MESNIAYVSTRMFVFYCGSAEKTDM